MARSKRYKKPPFPKTPYVLVTDEHGLDFGMFEVASFGDNGGGEYVSAGDAGSPFFLRVVKVDRDGLIHSEDGGGEIVKLRFVPLESSDRVPAA